MGKPDQNLPSSPARLMDNGLHTDMNYSFSVWAEYLFRGLPNFV